MLNKALFQLEILQKKRDLLSEKRESGMALKKREFTPESGSVDTYALDMLEVLVDDIHRQKISKKKKISRCRIS